jgi:hypothetical protein
VVKCVNLTLAFVTQKSDFFGFFFEMLRSWLYSVFFILN